jgi:hypothetical protein
MDRELSPGAVTPGDEIEQTERLIAELQSELSMIAAQLSDRNRLDGDTGARLDWRAFNDWRRRALYARTKKEEALRAAKLRRKELLRAGQRVVQEGGDPIAAHLALLCRVLTRRAAEGELEAVELDALSEAKAALKRSYGDNALGGRP